MSQDGHTPLHRASWKGHATVVGQLLAVGADTKAKDTVSGEQGMRVSDRAGSRRHTQHVRASFCLVAVCSAFVSVAGAGMHLVNI